jgi:hypothetical protein
MRVLPKAIREVLDDRIAPGRLELHKGILAGVKDLLVEVGVSQTDRRRVGRTEECDRPEGGKSDRPAAHFPWCQKLDTDRRKLVDVDVVNR